MAQKKVIWTATAARQRRLVLEYWLERNQSPNYSLKLLQLSNDKAYLIAVNPLLFKQTEFPGTRVATLGHFSMFYKVMDDLVLITAFWDSRQDPKKLLELLRSNVSQ